HKEAIVAIVPLVAALKDQDSDVRDNAARALEKYGQHKEAIVAIEPLVEALKDQDGDVRGSAANTLFRYSPYRHMIVAIEPLVTLLKDEDSEVRGIAAIVLGKFGKAELIPILSEAVIRDPESDSIYWGRGLLYLANQEYFMAQLDFSKAIELEPFDYIYWLRAFTYLKQDNKQPELAELDFGSCYDTKETAIIIGWMEEWCALSEAEPTADLAVRLEELASLANRDDRYNRYVALVCRSVATLVRQDYQEARQLATEAVSESSEYEDGYFWLAMAHAYLGEFGPCLQNLNKVMSLEDRLIIPKDLLLPLAWLEKAQPKFYQEEILPWWSKYR
ncbi:MAG: HEAT repeat domain-containing protein, partial [Chloroflexi bacterium]|nr:HEAT repeat domain-containing protein [Chloroflexota bacterium]